MEIDDVKRLSPGLTPVAILLVILAATLFFLHQATNDPAKFGPWYQTLFIIGGTELLVLLVLIANNLLQLIRQYRSQATGSRLSARLILIFVALAGTPVSIVYYFSVTFLQHGIDRWFDVRVDSALNSAIQLSRSALDDRMREQLRRTDRMARELSGALLADVPSLLDEYREQLNATEVTLLTQSGHIIATSNSNPTSIVPHNPQEAILQQIRRGGPYVGLDPTIEDGLNVRVVLSVPYFNSTMEGRVLQTLVPVSDRVNKLTEDVQSGFAQYEEVSFMRGPLKFSIVLTLSLVLVLTLLGAIWAAFYSARRLVAPIRVLAIGTRLVASGDYGKRLPMQSTDELGYLVHSFNEMTRKLANARDAAARSQQEAEGQRAYLEAVLGRLSSGVLVVDGELCLRIANSAANQITGVALHPHVGQSLLALRELSAVFSHLVDAIVPQLRGAKSEWREEVTVFGSSGRQVLMCRGAMLGGAAERERSYVIVFDDITNLIQAQRDAAWGEVARRLAHEIKNPLTPIQLSAERLRHKYLKTMEPKDADVLDRATHTIVQQVEVMKEMVKAFSEYARTPKLKLHPIDANRLIDEVLDLYRSDDARTSIEAQLDSSLPSIEADSGRLRQLMHNLIKNALEAMSDVAQPHLRVATRPCTDRGNPCIEIVVRDNGPGIPNDLIGKVFEPYVTTKPKGSGLGLAIVKKIVEEHGGTISAENIVDGGAQLTVRLPLANMTSAPMGVSASHHD